MKISPRPRDVLPAFVIAAMVAAGSLLPFEGLRSWPATVTALSEGSSLFVVSPAWGTVIERAVSFVPLSFFALRAFPGRPLRVAASLSMFALGIETLQSFDEGRHPQITDFMIASAWSTITVAFASITTDRTASRAIPWVLLTLLLVTGLATFTAYGGASLADWDCSYDLVVANETTGDRPWLGSISSLRIYATALSDEDIRYATRERSEADQASDQVRPAIAYDFSRGADGEWPAQGTGGPALRLWQDQSGAARITDRGIEIDAPVRIQSATPPAQTCEAIKESNSFTVLMSLSVPHAQVGPARIVSLSNGPYQRNMSIGQENFELELRIRNGASGPNGTDMTVDTVGEALTQGVHAVAASFGAGIGRLWVDGVPAAPPVVYYAVLQPTDRMRFLGLASIFMAAGLAFLLRRSLARRIRYPIARIAAAACLAWLPSLVLVTAAALRARLPIDHMFLLVGIASTAAAATFAEFRQHREVRTGGA